jgi:DNA-binding CsgD family transcriptional regulator
VDTLVAEPILLVSLKRWPTELVSVAPAGSSAGLTTREALVARLLSERQSNLEIATILGISPHTARHHTEQVLVKLGLHSRSGVRARLHQTP